MNRFFTNPNDSRIDGLRKAGALFLLAWCLVGSALAATANGDKPEQVNLQSTEGRAINNDNLEGKVTVLWFWRSSCRHSRGAVEGLRKLDEQFGDQGVQLIGVSFDQHKREMQKLIDNQKMTWPQVFAKKQVGGFKQVQKTWRVNNTPHVVILSPAGAKLWSGRPNDMAKPLARAVEQANTEKTLQPGRWTSRIEALDVFDKIAAQLEKGDNPNEIGNLIAELPQDSFVDPRVVERGGQIIEQIEQEAITHLIEGNEKAQPNFYALQAAIDAHDTIRNLRPGGGAAPVNR